MPEGICHLTPLISEGIIKKMVLGDRQKVTFIVVEDSENKI
jgi:hypothetical protein